ncbi:MAG: Gfo/Idh/MocA family oxidoreductase [Gemmatimonadota bacterium]|nr:Gfo/Idh/MocA family oxidoreductase [Gemmatimonadota bacterium]
MTDGREGPVRVGLLGAGSVAQVAHLQAYRRLRSVELVALCDEDPTKRRALRERGDAERVVETIDDLLEIESIDAVDVCLPSHLHHRSVLQCLEAGRHVLCEKPLALDPAGVEEIVRAAREADRAVLVGMNNRYRDDSIQLKELLEDEALGELYHVRAGWLQRRERIRPDHWQYQKEKSGGGVTMDLGIHLLDLALWLTDYPGVERVSACFHRHMPEIEVEDTAIAQIRCRGGLSIALEASWHYLLQSDRHYFEVHGTEGSGLLNPLRVHRRMHGGLVDATPQGQRPTGNLYMESYEREIAFFAEVVAGREEAPPLEEQLVLARALSALERSAETGREVSLDEAR